jgi:hypothetical protein
MPIFNRDDAIEALRRRLDIPQFVYPHQVMPGIGPCDQEYFAKECLKNLPLLA